MTDIMEGWNRERFVTAEYDGNTTVVLTDIRYWSENYDKLLKWCDVTGCDPVGMTVDIPSPELLTAFALRWS